MDAYYTVYKYVPIVDGTSPLLQTKDIIQRLQKILSNVFLYLFLSDSSLMSQASICRHKTETINYPERKLHVNENGRIKIITGRCSVC